DFRFDQTVVDTTFVAFRARDRHQGTVGQDFGSIAAADHGRDTELTRNNRRVASPPTTVGDDGRGTLHDGFPVRVGHVGYQYVAGFDFVHFGNVGDQAHFARTDFLA